MSQSYALFALLCVAVAGGASAGFIQTHHAVHEPVLAKVGAVVHSAPSAVSHQSFTRVHNKAVVESVVAPVVKTTVHATPAIVPVVHAAPLVHAAPVVHAAPLVHGAPAAYVKTVHHAVPVVKTLSAPIVHSYAAAPVVHSVPVLHSAPVVKTIVPATYALHH